MPHVTAAPAPVTISGRQRMMHPLRDVDFEEINNWLRGQFIETIRKSMSSSLSPSDRSEILQATVLAARKLSFKNATDTEFDLEKILVMAKMIQQGIRPEISVDEVMTAFTNEPSEAGAALLLWTELNVPKEDTAPTGSPKAGEKTARTRRKSTDS